jgi:Dolichyl-phosphate-mannose-protein mannosyltransferase
MTRPAASCRRWRRARSRLHWLALAVLAIGAAGFLALGLGEAWSDAPTFDEPVYVAAGLAAVLHHDLTLNDEHPPVPKVLAALPVLLVHPVIPGNGRWAGNDEHSYSARFIGAQLSAGIMRRVTFAARLVPLAETVGVAFAVFGLGSELLGPAAGALGGLLWLASPLVLGIGHLDGTDVPFALATVTASWVLARWLRLRSRRALLWLGLALAGAALSDISGLLVVASALAVVAVATFREAACLRSGARQALAHIALACLVAVAAVWTPYAVLDPGVLGHPGLLPSPYLGGISYLWAADTAAPGYLVGVSYTGGRWWFWPLSLVIKLPAAALLLFAAGAVAWLPADPAARRRALLAVGFPAVLLTGFFVTMPRDIGVRYLLPVLALWAAASGALVPAVTALRPAARRAAAGGACGLLAAAAVTTVTSFPTSLSWTAPPFRPGYAVATNSNLDWGQGLYALRAWAAGRRPWVSYFGPRGLAPDPVPGGRQLLGTSPGRVSGWVAVSATALTSADRSQLAWLQGYCPVRVLDGSVLIYRFRHSPAPEPSPGRPPSPCPGTWSHVTGTAPGS